MKLITGEQLGQSGLRAEASQARAPQLGQRRRGGGQGRWAGPAGRSAVRPRPLTFFNNLNKLETFFYFVTLNEFSVKANKYQNQYKNSHLKKNSVRDARTVDRLA